MKVLLVAGGRRLLQDPLLEAVEAVHAAGGSVSTITWFPVGSSIATLTDAHVELRAVDAARRARPRTLGITPVDRRLKTLHRRATAPRAALRRRWDKLLRKAKVDRQAALVHRLVSTDVTCQALVSEADVLVSGDLASVRMVWLAARRRPEVVAINGLAAFVTHLTLQREAHGAVSGRGS